MVEKKAPPIPQPLSSVSSARPAAAPAAPMQSAPTQQPKENEMAAVFEQVEKIAPIVSKTPVEHPQEEQHGLYDDNFAADLNLPVKLLRTKSMAVILGSTFLLGLIFGGVFFSGGSTQVVQGLGGVVGNPDLEKNTPRCGQVAKGRSCVLYLMNTSRQDKYAEKFFDEATRLTEAAKFSIQMANPQYAKKLIKPGYLAQIKIPGIN